MGRAWFRGLTLVSAALCLAGCGPSGVQRHDLSGKVTYKGQPIPAGVIYFDPDIKKGNDGPGGFAYIKDGEFDSSQGGRGSVGGPHVVRIQGFDGKPGNELPMGKPLFSEYSTTADLPKEKGSKDFDVPASAGKRP